MNKLIGNCASNRKNKSNYQLQKNTKGVRKEKGIYYINQVFSSSSYCMIIMSVLTMDLSRLTI